MPSKTSKTKSKEDHSNPPKDQTKPTLRPPIKVKVVDYEQLRENKMMMYDFVKDGGGPEGTKAVHKYMASKGKAGGE